MEAAFCLSGENFFNAPLRGTKGHSWHTFEKYTKKALLYADVEIIFSICMEVLLFDKCSYAYRAILGLVVYI